MFQSPNKKRHKEQQFQEKLNEAVRLIKNREEICLQTIQYLQSIISNRDELQSLMFLQDQISKHKFFLQKVNKKIDDLKNKQRNILLAFSTNQELGENQKSLVKRVTARILEVFQNFNEKVEKYSHFQKQIYLHYKNAKSKFIRLITLIEKNNSNMGNVSQLCIAFFQYLTNKYSDQCKKLNRIIQFIENGDIHRIQQAYYCEHCRQIQAIQQQKNENKSVNILKKQKGNQQKNIKDNYESKFFSKQKDKINQKLKVMRLEQKNKQALKKKRTKFANKCYTLYQSAMDLHKAYFIDQLTFTDQNEQTQKILQQMTAKNRENQNFIKGFIRQCSEKNMKLKTKYGFSFEEQKRYDDFQEVSINSQKIKNSIQINFQDQSIFLNRDDQETVQSLNYHNSQKFAEIDQKSEIKSFRITNPNKKSIVPTPKSNPNLFAIKETTQSFNFVKINMKNNAVNLHRARLPDISNRLFSMDDKRKSMKIGQKQHIAVSQNNLLIIKTSLTRGGPSQDPKQKDLKKRQNQSQLQNKNKKIKKSQSGNKLILDKNTKGSSKTLEINYSTSVSKKIHKFCEIVSTKQQVY